MPDTMPEFWDDTPVLMSGLYGKQFYRDNSRRPGYKFKAYHYHDYNRYSERVSAASHLSGVTLWN
jgi:hypothetical protein